MVKKTQKTNVIVEGTLIPRRKPKFRRFKKMYKTSNYKRGRAFEYRTKGEYIKTNHWVVRSYASKGASDLYCFRKASTNALLNQNVWKCLQHVPNEYHKFIYEMLEHLTELVLVQCKTRKGLLGKLEIDALVALGERTGGTPMHVYRDDNRPYKMHYEKIERTLIYDKRHKKSKDKIDV